MLLCPIAGNGNFGHLVEVVTARSFCCVFSFVISKCLVERCFETVHIHCFSSYFLLLILASIHECNSKQL